MEKHTASAAACGAATLRWQTHRTSPFNIPLPHTIIRWLVENLIRKYFY
jgi:hypothetical protein